MIFDLGDRAGVWRLIEDFAAHWASPLTPGDGVDEAELTAAEERLCLRLPDAMRQAYRLFGRRDDLTDNQDVLLDLAGIGVDGDVLVYRVENQGAAYWGVRLTDLDQADPPVVMRLDLVEKDAESWEPWLDRFSLACAEIVLSESLFADGPVNNAALADATALEQLFERLPVPEYPASRSGPGTRWFAGPDVVLREDQRQRLWVRARTSEALARVLAELPCEWEL
ncbi:hypothetical protein Lesp02_49560 [Lentzea sp. NBRC 105346]|uniref:hypothetical protein n=1 Tax=Lentzea sp. NBRC 105346 TaxID=3032205 RepID=UPI0024A34A55|nr:hypothetical protein [Lentzea sp. NBRC 105346]GLZ32768.1 hypothetical protein Lesp02_49560 [Lentzea sp. NBRC 105346]